MTVTCPKVWGSWGSLTLPLDLIPRTAGPGGRFHDLAHVLIVACSKTTSGIDNAKDQWSKTHFWDCGWLRTCEGTFHRAYSSWSLVVPVQSNSVCLSLCLFLSWYLFLLFLNWPYQSSARDSLRVHENKDEEESTTFLSLSAHLTLKFLVEVYMVRSSL